MNIILYSFGENAFLFASTQCTENAQFLLGNRLHGLWL